MPPFSFTVMFYADDSLLLVRSHGEAEDMIRLVVEVSGKCVLNINKVKSNVLVYNCRGGASGESRGNRSSYSSVRYLGTDLDNSRQCFDSYKNGKLVLAERMTNLHGVVCCVQVV